MVEGWGNVGGGSELKLEGSAGWAAGPDRLGSLMLLITVLVTVLVPSWFQGGPSFEVAHPQAPRKAS